MSNPVAGSAALLPASAFGSAADTAALTAAAAAAPIQPYSAYLALIRQFFNVSAGSTIDFSAHPEVTAVDPALLVNWLSQFLLVINSDVYLSFEGCSISGVFVILTAILAAFTDEVILNPDANNIYLYFSGGTNAAVSPATPRQDGIIQIQLPAPLPANAGNIVDFTFGPTSLNYADSPFAGSDYANIGVSDSPSMAAVVAYLNTPQSGYLGGVSPWQNLFFGDFTGAVLHADGSASVHDANEADYPIACTGSAVVSVTPGTAEVPNAVIVGLNGYGCTVNTN